MQLAALLLIQSLSFNSSSSALTPAQLSWLNPFGLPTAANPTYPDCDAAPEVWEDWCNLMYDPGFENLGIEVLVPKWQWTCRHGWCPWDYDLWIATYEDECGFWGECEETPGWVEPTWELTPTSAVPEPASLLLVATGLAGVAAARRRLRRRPCEVLRSKRKSRYS